MLRAATILGSVLMLPPATGAQAACLRDLKTTTRTGIVFGM